MAIKKDTLDGLLAGRDPQAVFAKDGLFDELKKALAERVLSAEIDDIWTARIAAGGGRSRSGTPALRRPSRRRSRCIRKSDYCFPPRHGSRKRRSSD